MLNSIVMIALTAFAAPRTKLHIVTTLSDLRSIASDIGGDEVEAINLAHGKQDPHFVDPKPSYLVKLRDADLFILNGLDLEVGWVPPLLDGARNPKVLKGGSGYLDVSKDIPVLEIPAVGTTRAEGDVHPLGNPHYLLDPVNGGIVARTICSKLKELRPESGPLFDENLASFHRRLYGALYGEEWLKAIGVEKLERLSTQDELAAFLQENEGLASKLGGWVGRLRDFRGMKIVSYHKSLSYLVHRFGLEVIDYVEPKPGIPPSAGHVENLAAKIKKEGAKFILTHHFYDAHVPGLLAERTGVRVVTIPASVDGVKEASNYVELFQVIVGQIASTKN